ncbi:hypothetical protein [Methylobacterium sp. 275MFSha3.1]|uniref:hypothetical protein n=1 Tax=Methylobacterium sp. 275MFSha3.1 TaxID=1502746 RepID=UPI000B83DDA2|nr:hypothetical protein [Methylobacterium sp. 275MFSha3.1]
MQDASAPPEIQAAAAPIAADEPAQAPATAPAPAPDHFAEAVRTGAETAPDGAVDVPPDPVATAAATTSEAEFEARSEAESGDEAVIDIAPPPVPGAGPGRAAAANRISFTPDRLDVVEIGSIIARYVRGEGEAAVAHLRALSGARSPADVIRLQVGEVQRAADACLTCWVTVVGQASRVVAYR